MADIGNAHVLEYMKNILSCDKNFMALRSDIMLQHLYIWELQYMHFQFDYLCSVTT